MIDLKETFFDAVGAVDWFASVGRPWTAPALAVTPVATLQDALASLNADTWLDAKTEAQGALTGCLARHHWNEYGTRWNELAKQATTRLDADTRPVLQDRLQTLGWPMALAQPILVDLTRAALEASFRTAFPKAPVFFEHLFSVYAAGHLPCGWSGDLDAWPRGRLLVY